MAKVTGPLMSMDASGKFGGTLVFGKWKGRNTVRQLVTPANPNTQLQENARNAVRVVGVAQKWANITMDIRSGETLTDKELLKLNAPSGQAWNGFLSKSMIGLGAENIEGAQAAWTALSPTNKTTWNDAAAALTPPIPAAYQTDEFGVAGTPLTAGNVFYIYVNGLFVAGVGAAPVADTPPTYA